MVLKNISPGCGVWVSLMLFFGFYEIQIYTHFGVGKIVASSTEDFTSSQGNRIGFPHWQIFTQCGDLTFLTPCPSVVLF